MSEKDLLSFSEADWSLNPRLYNSARCLLLSPQKISKVLICAYVEKNLHARVTIIVSYMYLRIMIVLLLTRFAFIQRKKYHTYEF